MRNFAYDNQYRNADGYCLDGLSIYNPKSVVESVLRNSYSNYWTFTETYEALKEHIQRNFDGLKEKITQMIAGERVRNCAEITCTFMLVLLAVCRVTQP